MSDEVSVLRAAWMSQGDANVNSLRAAAARIIDQDEADRLRERRMRSVGLTAMLVMVPVLVWAAAYGVAPIIRAAYSLMAVGCAAAVGAEWLYLGCSRQALPGPRDTRSQLQQTAFMLDCQIWLWRTAAVWSAPIFIGVLLIGVWLYRERTIGAAVAVCVPSLAAWIVVAVAAARASTQFGRRRQQLKAALADLGER